MWAILLAIVYKLAPRFYPLLIASNHLLEEGKLETFLNKKRDLLIVFCSGIEILCIESLCWIMKLSFLVSPDADDDCNDEVDGPASSDIITTSSIDFDVWYGEFEREFVLLKSAN